MTYNDKGWVETNILVGKRKSSVSVSFPLIFEWKSIACCLANNSLILRLILELLDGKKKPPLLSILYSTNSKISFSFPNITWARIRTQKMYLIKNVFFSSYTYQQLLQFFWQPLSRVHGRYGAHVYAQGVKSTAVDIWGFLILSVLEITKNLLKLNSQCTYFVQVRLINLEYHSLPSVVVPWKSRWGRICLVSIHRET